MSYEESNEDDACKGCGSRDSHGLALHVQVFENHVKYLAEQDRDCDNEKCSKSKSMFQRIDIGDDVLHENEP